MHELIMHNSICRRLDCWRVEAKKCDPKWTSLEEFAVSEPTWEDIKAMALGNCMGKPVGVRSRTRTRTRRYTHTRGAGTGLLAGISQTDPGYYPQGVYPRVTTKSIVMNCNNKCNTNLLGLCPNPHSLLPLRQRHLGAETHE